MNIIGVKEVEMEDTINYHKTAMLVAMGKCDWKCCHKDGEFHPEICQNTEMGTAPDKMIDVEWLCSQYANNPITSALVISGLDPINDFKGLMILCRAFRAVSDDDIVIYTGYNEEEIPLQVQELKQFITKQTILTSNLIVKFGRFVPDSNPVYDPVLGIHLVSNNQVAKYIRN